MEHIRIRRTARNLRERFQSPAQQRWGTEPCRIYGARNGRILLPMTRHKHTHTGLVTPSLPQLLLTAMLHLFAMLVSSVASTLQMTRRRLPAECHSDVTPAGLPRETTDTFKEPEAVPQDGTLTIVSHTSPSPSVSLATQTIHLPLLRRWRQRDEGELPPSVRSTGGGGSPRLRGETEGASRHIPRSVGCILMHLFASAAPRCIKMHPTRSTP